MAQKVSQLGVSSEYQRDTKFGATMRQRRWTDIYIFLINVT
jgi:hypothetical protein